MSASDDLERYADRHFVDRGQFLRSAGINDGFFRELIAARALPGPIYRLWSNGAFWSPIGGAVGVIGAGEPRREWFSPAATWWARRAALMMASAPRPADQIAAALEAIFRADFLDTLRTPENGRHGYADLYANGTIDETEALRVACAEWNDWIDGGYGVCLRRFDAFHLVAKTNESAHVRHLTNEGRKAELSAGESLELLEALDRLDAVMLPFAPHQRPFGTPGKWVDAILAKYGLGEIPLIDRRHEEPFMLDQRHCA